MDNFYEKCPARMEDGRFASDYRSSSRRDETYKYVNNIVRDDEYRMFLQQNGEKLINNMWENVKNTSCFPNRVCVHTYPTRVNPIMFNEEMAAYNKKMTSKDTEGSFCQKQQDYTMF
jgi:hypothetical protein